MIQPASSPLLAGLSIAVVGPGRLGTSLALAITRAGVPLAGFFGVNVPDLRRATTLLQHEPVGSLDELIATGANTFFLTVPDSAISSAAEELSSALERAARLHAQAPPVLVLHTSGATPVSALDPCARAGAVAIGFHPLQTFSDPVTGPERLRGCAVAIASDHPLGRETGWALAEAVGGRPFLLDERNRPLYHAAACIASNYLVALAFLAERLFVRAGLPSDTALEAFMPLVAGAVDNMTRQGTVAALTGPLSRGDVTTILSHLQSLSEEAPEALPAYEALGSVTLDIIRARGDLPRTTISSLEHALSSGTYGIRSTPAGTAGENEADPARCSPARAAGNPPVPTIGSSIRSTST
jgi:predicted short-subunit dehydrogenase-like oxidoreductase (DUF2520 family)